MTRFNKYLFIIFFQLSLLSSITWAANEIPANHPYIQYFGRWDFTNPLAPTHSWPGVYVYAEFEGTSIGVKTDDNACWYNVFIDGAFTKVFQGKKAGINNYTLASGLQDGHHTILFTLRGETSWTKFAFNGFVLDDGKNLLPPPAKPAKKIEFIGDSFTSSSGNEWTESGPSPNESYTNIYLGFGSIVSRNYGAQYQITSRGGIGLVIDYLGNYSNNLPDYFDRTLFFTPLPKWDFEQWVPNLAVVCLGLNDYAGFGGYSGTITQDKTDLYKTRYHAFLSTIRDAYPGVKILAVAANGVEWIKTCVSQVVEEENAQGKNDIFYTYFPFYDGGYVNNGHPTVATHQKIAARIISALDTLNVWEPYVDTAPPKIVKYPAAPFTIYDTTYTLNVQTDSYSTLRYSTSDKPYDQMEFDFTSTGKRDHSVTLPCKHGQQYSYYLRAKDINGNMMDSSAIVNFTIDTTKVVSAWKTFSYNHSNWKMGASPLGNDNSASIKTKVADGITTYFRKKITVDSVAKITGLGLMIKGHDGAIAYLNGQKVGLINLFENEETFYNTLALSSTTLNKMFVINAANGLSKLHNGENIIAVEMHASSGDTPAILFDSQIFDNSNKIYYALGSDWFYYDTGNEPPLQITDKVTGIVERDEYLLPNKIELYANYPNPFNPETNISFYLNKKSSVKLKVFDMLGNLIETLVDNELQTGKHNYKFVPTKYSSGIYFYQLQTESFNQVRKMVLLK